MYYFKCMFTDYSGLFDCPRTYYSSHTYPHTSEVEFFSVPLLPKIHSLFEFVGHRGKSTNSGYRLGS